MYVLIYLYVVIVPLVRSFLIHHLMTADEVMEIFHTTHDAVPEYELVPVLYWKIINERSTTKLHVKAFKENIELYLNKTDGYLASKDTPVWTARSDRQSPEGLQYTLIHNALANIGEPMQNENSGAAVLVRQQDHKLPVFDGVLPFNFIIRSLPARIINNILYGENGLFKDYFTKNETIRDLILTYHHIVYKKAPKKNNENFIITNPLTRMYEIPDVIYPEVLVVIDYNLYKTLGRNVKKATRYVVAFWNGVDLIYRALTKPKVRLTIAGIIIAMDDNAIPYVEKNRLHSNLLDADQALHGMGSYFYKEKRIPWKVYDMAICNTRLNLCNKLDKYTCDPATLGYAYVAGACNRNRTEKFSEAVGIVEDDGGFIGIIPTAHELGHLLGAHHDGSSDDANCSASNRNIMSNILSFSKNEFKWSNCSIKSFHKFLSEDRAKCLYDEPPKAMAVRRILPGKLISSDDQCKKSYGGRSCNKNSPSICYELECIIPETNGLCIPIAAAADGTSCGNHLICLDGKCVLKGSETKNEKIPDSS